mmetsp:Transcript_27965/g.63264  ORF Transcript_27965/g.63264 Transcript_27965/m.63264 type:complete len:357 (+) Transcript_27965:302-1372(+)
MRTPGTTCDTYLCSFVLVCRAAIDVRVVTCPLCSRLERRCLCRRNVPRRWREREQAAAYPSRRLKVELMQKLVATDAVSNRLLNRFDRPDVVWYLLVLSDPLKLPTTGAGPNPLPSACVLVVLIRHPTGVEDTLDDPLVRAGIVGESAVILVAHGDPVVGDQARLVCRLQLKPGHGDTGPVLALLAPHSQQPEVDGVHVGGLPLEQRLARARLIRIYDRREDDPIVPVDKLPQRVLERVEPFVAVLARGHVGKYVWQLWQRKKVLLLHSKRLTSKVVPFLRSRKPWRQHLPAQRHQPNGKCLAEQVAPTDAACVVREEARHSHPVHSHLVVYYQLPVEHSLTQDALAIAAWEVHRG